MTLKARLTRLERGPGGIRRFIVAICGARDDLASVLADRGLVESSADLLVAVRKPGVCSACVSVDGVPV